MIIIINIDIIIITITIVTIIMFTLIIIIIIISISSKSVIYLEVLEIVIDVFYVLIIAINSYRCLHMYI